MSAKEFTSESLNEQQVMMLRLLKKPLPDADFVQIRRLAVKLLSKTLDETIEQWEKKNEITADDHERAGKMHFRSSPQKS